MSVAVNAVVNGTPVTATSITISCTPAGSNRYMLIDVGVNNPSGPIPTVSSAVFNGSENATLISRQEANNGEMALERWGLVAPSATTANLVVTLSASQEFNAVVSTFTGVNQSTPLGTSVIDTYSAGGFAHSHATTSETDGLVWDTFIIRGDATSLTPDAGQTTQVAHHTIGTTGNGLDGIVSSEPGAASVTTGYTWGTAEFGRWVHVTSPIKPVGAVAGQPTQKRFGGVPHTGTTKFRGGHSGGPWGRGREGLIVPRYLIERKAA